MPAFIKEDRLLLAAVKYSIPVLLGYPAIGFAFGLLMTEAGYPWWLTLFMSVVMYAGAGQFISIGLFAAGVGLWEAALVQLVVNARHIAYGLSMIKRMTFSGFRKLYCIFGMTDETFALLSSLPSSEEDEICVPGLKEPIPAGGRSKFMFLITFLNQIYWVSGSLIGAFTGTLIPFSIEGIGFALTALFIVLMLEQMFRIRKSGIFFISALPAVLAVIFLPSRMSLLAAIAIALAVSSILYRKERMR
ncbi:MAG: AzlC family ABC transporter permease [Treponema sp.]|nr:AzlC family ABC transporter permease [Treponema sp.]MCL2271335.1 AzlC family ABC transporter permease [Treponema sp.]